MMFILSGIAVSSILSAFYNVLVTLFPDAITGMVDLMWEPFCTYMESSMADSALCHGRSCCKYSACRENQFTSYGR